MKILFFQIYLFLWNNNSVTTECLRKNGFGLSNLGPNTPLIVPITPVDGKNAFPSLDECQTRCEELV